MNTQLFEKYFDSVPERMQFLFRRATNTLWEPLNRLEEFLEDETQPKNSAIIKGEVYIEGDVEIGEGSVIEHGAVIIGPVILGKNCHVRAGAYIRGNVIAGDGCVIGHSTEVIRSILLDDVRVDHFNYVGDSILGNGVHFGAGAKVANLRFDEKEIVVQGVSTGRVKFGGVFGDRCHLGLNVSVGPGVIFEKGTWYAGPGPLKSGLYNRDTIPRF